MLKSELMEYVEIELGIVGWKLPTTKEYMDTLIRTGIKRFSRFYPKLKRISLDFDKYFNHEEEIYSIPLDITLSKGEDIIDIGRLYYQSVYDNSNSIDSMIGSKLNGFVNVSSRNYNNSYNSIMDELATDTLRQAVSSPLILPIFTSPNKIQIENFRRIYLPKKMDINILVSHSNITYIPETVTVFFSDYMVTFIKRSLYEVLKHYETIETIHGSINLRIDDWSNARSELKDMEKELDLNSVDFIGTEKIRYL